MRIAVLGGTGALGRGLALRFAAAGATVVLGSRDGARAVDRALELSAALAAWPVSRPADPADAAAAAPADPAAAAAPAAVAAAPADPAGSITGAANPDAARTAEVVVVAVPWDAHAETLRACAAELAGKVVVDAVNPLGFDAGGAYPLRVAEGSAAEQAQGLLPDSRVVAAFHTLPAAVLADPGSASVEADTFVVGDDRAAVDLVLDLARTIPGLHAYAGGRLRNAGPLEGLTAAVISANRRHRIHAGIRVVEL